VNPALSSLLEFEVLDYVRDIDRRGVDPSLIECATQQLAGRTNEGMTLPVLLVAWLFSDQHDPRIAGTFTKNGLCGVSIQIASMTFLNSRPKSRKPLHTGQIL